MFERPQTGERAVLVRLGLGKPLRNDDLVEFDQLARSAGATPVATVTGRRHRPEPRFFVGSGKAEEIHSAAQTHGADLILIDHPLSPSQERNLEKLTGRRVLDRSGLILDIFAQRARTFEGKLQVELAQLKHLSTRLVRGWTHLERQKGGIGLRGPGETQLETDRRLLATRVRSLTAKLRKLQQQRDTGRSARAAVPVPGVALVGYTNAGKSTLFHALTGADAYIADQLFATLDPTVRKLTLPGGGAIVVADTVGFIRELPHELIAAFQSTLQEARSAQLLLHVIDAADPRREEYTGQVDAVLAEIGAGQLPQLLVYNKIDRLDLPPRIERDERGLPTQVWISAAQNQGLDLVAGAIAERLQLQAQRGWLRISPAAGALRAQLLAGGAVREERTEDDGTMRLLIELPPAQMAALARNPKVALSVVTPAQSCAPARPSLESFGSDTPGVRRRPDAPSSG